MKVKESDAFKNEFSSEVNKTNRHVLLQIDRNWKKM